jgi:hypothetical protein
MTKIVDMKPHRGRPRRDSPAEPMVAASIRLPLSLWQRINDTAKANFRTTPEEIRMRLTRDLDNNP